MVDDHAARPLTAQPLRGSPRSELGSRVQLDGILFMEGENEPSEISKLKRDLRALSQDATETGEWLDAAMESSWSAGRVAPGSERAGGCARRSASRHRQRLAGRRLSSLVGRLLQRSVDILDRVEFSPAGLRRDLADQHLSVKLLYGAAEIISHTADLLSDSAGFDNDNERRWRVFHAHVREIVTNLDDEQ